MPYPEELLAQNDFKYIDVSELVGKEYFVIRRSNPDEKLINSDTGEINIDAVCEFVYNDNKGINECFGLSLNLFGVFKKEHLSFILKKPSNTDYWQENEPQISLKEISFITKEINEIIKIKIDDFFVFEKFTYKKPQRKKEGDPLWEELRKKKNAKEIFENTELEGIAIIEHKPLRGNFWHFEWNFYEDFGNGKKIIKEYKAYSNEIAVNWVETTIKEIVKKYDEEIYNLPENIYKK